jgi:hypothetical protein
MQRVMALAITLLGFGTTSAGYAQTPLRVWVYGDGNTGRMYSELRFMLSGTGLTVTNKARESTGTDSLLGNIYLDFLATPQTSWPQVVVIGYSASAASLWHCAVGTWVPDVALQEAHDILTAAAALKNANVKVVLSLGPGVPANGGSPCIEQALQIVNAFVSSSGYRTVSWSLTRTTARYWCFDFVHISCDPARYRPAGAPQPCRDFQGNELPRDQQQPLGALEVARRVKAVLQTLQ